MNARISISRRAPRRALLALLIATFFVPTGANALVSVGACGTGGPTKAEAVPLSLQANTCNGDNGFTGEHWFKWDFTAPTSFGLRFDRAGKRVEVIGPQGLLAPTVGTGDPTSPAEWHYRLPAGTYWLRIKVATFDFTDFTSSFLTDYVFDYRYVPQNDCNTFGDAGNSKATASEVSLPVSCTGAVWGSEFNSSKVKDPEDWYKLTLNQGETFNAYVYGYADVTDGCGANGPELAATGCSSDILGISGPAFELRNAAGAPIAESPPAQSNLGTITYPVPQTGTYYLRVSHTQDDLYSLTMATTSVAVPDTSNLLGNDSCAQGDASNTQAGANELFPNDLVPSACYGSLGSPETDTADWYKFNATGTEQTPQMINFQLDADTLSAAYEIIDPSGAVAASGTANLGITVPNTLVPVAKPGVWKLKVAQGFQGSAGHYEFTLDLRAGVGAIPSIPPSLPPIGLNLLNDSCTQPGSVDAANDRANASQVYSLPNTLTPYCYGTLGMNGDTGDWFKFDAPSGFKFSFMLSGDGALDPNLYLYRPNGTLFQSFANFGATPDYTVQQPLDAAGVWTMRVAPASTNQTGTYALAFDWRGELVDGVGVPSNLPTAIPTIPSIGLNLLNDDCFGTGDASNSSKTPRQVSNQTACMGTLAMTAADTYDWYSFPGQAGMSVVVGVSGDGNLDPNLTLFTPSGTRVLNYANKSPMPDYIRYDMTQTGTYKIAITRANPASGYYGLFIDVPQVSGGIPFVPSSVPAAPSLSGDCGQGGDAPNRTHRDVRYQKAQDYNPNNACMGSLGGADKEDWYQFGGTTGQHFNLSLSSNYSLDADVWLIDPNGIWRLKSANGGATPESVYNFILDKTGTWKIRVASAFGSGDYGISSTLSNY